MCTETTVMNVDSWLEKKGFRRPVRNLFLSDWHLSINFLLETHDCLTFKLQVIQLPNSYHWRNLSKRQKLLLPLSQYLDVLDTPFPWLDLIQMKIRKKSWIFLKFSSSEIKKKIIFKNRIYSWRAGELNKASLTNRCALRKRFELPSKLN